MHYERGIELIRILAIWQALLSRRTIPPKSTTRASSVDHGKDLPPYCCQAAGGREAMIHHLEQSGSLKCLSSQQVLEFSERIRRLAQAGGSFSKRKACQPEQSQVGAMARQCGFIAWSEDDLLRRVTDIGRREFYRNHLNLAVWIRNSLGPHRNKRISKVRGDRRFRCLRQ